MGDAADERGAVMGLLDERWESNGTVYTFRKMTAMEQYKVAVPLLPLLGSIASEIRKLREEGVSLSLSDEDLSEAEAEAKQMRFIEAAMTLLADLPEDRLELARQGLFPHIEYSRQNKPGGRVSDDVNVALQGQDFTVVFMLILRSFCVNFTVSSLSRIEHLAAPVLTSSQSAPS
ncbi:MAG: hypothetical protein OXC29_09880 [Rhodococcus sp.]|nr:hypothetical protein [Rhodococcus sp. (in: high G+C Gram-positive bacteria)]